MRFQNGVENEARRNNVVYVALVLVILVIGFIKTKIGIHSDEIHSIAVADMIARGDRIFKDCWFYLQLSSVISAPFIWIYRHVTGYADGLILFLRIISVLIQGGISLLFYITFSKNRNRLYVFSAAVCLFMFIPDFLSFGYKPEMIWFTILEIIFAYRYCIYKQKKDLILIGVSLSLCVLAFPTAIIHLLVWTVFFIVRKDDWKKAVLYIVVSCVCCATIFFVFTLSEISISDFFRFFPEILKDDQLASNFITKLFHPTAKIAVLGIVSIVPLIIIDKISFFRDIIKKIPVITLLLVLAFLGQCYIERLGITWHCITYPYALTLFFLPYAYMTDSLDNRIDNRNLFWCFFAMSWASFFCFSLASNQGNITSIYSGIISVCGLLLILATDSNNPVAQERKSIAISLFVMAFVMFAIPVWDQEAIYPESYGMRTVFSNRVCIDKGPAKGIWVGQELYDNYMNLCDIIDREIENEDKVYIVDSAFYCSFGYLYQPGEYATYSPRGGYYDRIVEYYEVNKEKKPSVVIMSKNYIRDWEKWDFPYDREIYKYLSENGYVEEDTENFIVFRDKRN